MKPLLRVVFQTSLMTLVLGTLSLSAFSQTFASSRDDTGPGASNATVVLPPVSAPYAIEVSGTVRDESNQSLPGVNVIEKGTNNGTTTDASGRFSLSVTDQNSVLVFSFIGFVTQEIPVGNRTQFDVTMAQDVRSLDEVVVVGYGTQERADLTGAVASVSAKDILAVPVERMDQALQGRAAGVMVRQNTFAPGAGSVSVVIRGINSINGNNAPLYVIDGVIGANINALDPLDIQSIDILKDASAASIYGSRAANGVIIVTTKKGTPGKARVTFDAYYGVSNPMRLHDVMNAREYMEYVNDARAQANLDPAYSDIQSIVNQVGEGTDWQRELFGQGTQQKYFLSVSGGTDDVTYAASGGYLNTTGLMPNVDYRKFTARFDLGFKASEKLRFTAAMSYAGDVTHSMNETNGYDFGTINLIATPPMLKPTDQFGDYPPIIYNTYEAGTPSRYFNAFAGLQREIREAMGNYLQMNFGAEYKFTDWLKYEIQFGLQPTFTENRFFSPQEIPDPQYFEQSAIASKNSTRQNNWLVENLVTMNKEFNDVHDFTLVLGTSTQKTTYESTGAGSRHFAFEQFQFHNLGAGNPQNYSVSSSERQEALQSFFGRINYSFNDKYLVQVNGRYDGSSKFAKGNKWAFFPSASVGWRLSEEAFVQDMGLFDDMKLRVSYGSIGSHGINPYATMSLIGSTFAYGFNDIRVGTYMPLGIANPNLKWETTTQLDIGLDFGVMNNRLSFTLDYYHKKTTDLLMNQVISMVNNPNTNHDPSITRNVGSLQNTGFEFSVNYQPNFASELKWSVNLNGTFPKNKLLNLALNPGQDFLQLGDNLRRNYHRLEEGQPLGNYVGYQTDGLYQTEEEILGSAQPSARPGDIRYVDQNNDGIINGSDFVVLGNAYPDFFGGLTNNFTYKNFNLSVFLFAMMGQEVFNFELSRWKYDLSSTPYNKFKEVATQRWTGPGTSNDIPRAGYKPINITDGADGAIDRMIEDGSFLKLRNVTLTYNLPKAFVSRLGMSNANVYVQGNNLFILTKYTGFDPEANQMGGSVTLLPINTNFYPSTRNFMVGVQIGL